MPRWAHRRHFTVREIPQQNGMTERMNKTMLDKVRCLLSNAGLSKSFCSEALSYTCHLINRLPSSAIGGKTHLKDWSGKVAQDSDSLQVFDCLTYYHVKEDKLGPRARKGAFVGFKKVWNTTKFGIKKTRRSSWAGMSHLMRFQWWSLWTLSSGEW